MADYFSGLAGLGKSYIEGYSTGLDIARRKALFPYELQSAGLRPIKESLDIERMKTELPYIPSEKEAEIGRTRETTEAQRLANIERQRSLELTDELRKYISDLRARGEEPSLEEISNFLMSRGYPNLSADVLQKFNALVNDTVKNTVNLMAVSPEAAIKYYNSRALSDVTGKIVSVEPRGEFDIVKTDKGGLFRLNKRTGEVDTIREPDYFVPVKEGETLVFPERLAPSLRTWTAPESPSKKSEQIRKEEETKLQTIQRIEDTFNNRIKSIFNKYGLVASEFGVMEGKPIDISSLLLTLNRKLSPEMASKLIAEINDINAQRTRAYQLYRSGKDWTAVLAEKEPTSYIYQPGVGLRKIK